MTCISFSHFEFGGCLGIGLSSATYPSPKEDLPVPVQTHFAKSRATWVPDLENQGLSCGLCPCKKELGHPIPQSMLIGSMCVYVCICMHVAMVLISQPL